MVTKWALILLAILIAMRLQLHKNFLTNKMVARKSAAIALIARRSLVIVGPLVQSSH